MGVQEKLEKSTSEQLSAVLGQLSTDQIRFVVARQEYATDKEAAEAIGIKPNTVYKWPPEVAEAVRLMAADGLTTALHVRRRNVSKAMLVKVAGLDSGDERVRQGVATEIIEWEMGKATQPVETNIIMTWGDEGNNTTAAATPSTADGEGSPGAV